jgi:hypothetical protein
MTLNGPISSLRHKPASPRHASFSYSILIIFDVNNMSHFLITPQAAINRIWKGAVLAGVLMMNTTLVFADALDTPIGIWQTIDDNTNQPKALVQITQGIDGTLSGKVVKGLDLNDSPERRCTECDDERKDQKILGMTIIRV